MVGTLKLLGGYCSSTPTAQAVAAYFEERGVPREKLSINQTTLSGDECIAVQEGDDAEMTRSEYGRFMREANQLERAEDCRFATSEERCVILGYDTITTMSTQKDPAEMGQDLEDPAETEYSVFHNGGNRFTVTDGEGIYRVNMDAPEGERFVTVLVGDAEPDANGLMQAVIRSGPSYRPGPQEQLNVTVEGPQGNGGATQSSGDSEESNTSQSDSGNVDIISDPGSHDYDDETLIGNVEEWLSNYASVKPDLIDGGWHTEFARVTDPETGDSEIGVYIRSDPWDGPYWDQSDNTWTDGNGNAVDSQPDVWKDHKAAFRSIMSDEDGPVNAVSEPQDPNDPDGYRNWYNYIPAEVAQDV